VFGKILADEKSRIYIEFETLEKQCWSFLRNIKTATNVLHITYPYFSQEKFGGTLGFAKHWDFLF
jgi:hypothetical protein